MLYLYCVLVLHSIDLIMWGPKRMLISPSLSLLFLSSLFKSCDRYLVLQLKISQCLHLYEDLICIIHLFISEHSFFLWTLILSLGKRVCPQWWARSPSEVSTAVFVRMFDFDQILVCFLFVLFFHFLFLCFLSLVLILCFPIYVSALYQ